jgi:hypothetical protein
MIAIAIIALSSVCVTFVLATAAVLIVRLALREAASADRGPILSGVAQVIRAIRGEK